MKKLKGVSHLLLALIIAAAIASCDIDGGGIEPNNPTGPTGPTEPTNPTNPNDGKTHYSDYTNFNPADYPIINESGKSDSAIAWLKDIIWLCYAEREDVGEWTANYIKSNKIKTILSNEEGANAWMDPGRAHYVNPASKQGDKIYVANSY